MVMDTMVLTYSVLFIGRFVAEKEAEKRINNTFVTDHLSYFRIP